MSAKAWLLAVVSSDGQAETLDFQERWGQQIAAENGWTIERTFKDVSSGRDGARQLLKDLLEELRRLPRAARPARVLLVRIDRLGRGDGLEIIATLSEIKKLGVKLHTREDGDVKLERASDALMPAMKSILAGIENEVRADRTRAGLARRKSRGLHHGNAPYGATLLEGKPIAYEPEAVLVREIFTLRTQGWGYDRLARFAAERALPKLLRDGNTRRLRWGRSTIQRLLWCSTLRDVVVDPELFDRVQATKNPDFKSLRQQSWPFPLAHAVRCTCGTLLSGQCSGRAGYRTRYYVCRSVARHGYYPHHNACTLESQFQQQLRRIRASDGLTFAPRIDTTLDDLHARETALRNELAALERRRERTWEIGVAGDVPAAEVRLRLSQIAADRERYEAELTRLQTEIQRAAAAKAQERAVEGILRDLERSWPRAPLDCQQEAALALAAIVGGFWLAPGRRGRGRRRIDSTLETGLDAPAVDAAARYMLENMREVDTLRNVDMAQRKMDDSITKKFIQSITE
jgi:DNA invertase Pin-like site-specific DNA recombinase/predicted DNA-binding ribbon-helix-helix protein